MVHSKASQALDFDLLLTRQASCLFYGQDDADDAPPNAALHPRLRQVNDTEAGHSAQIALLKEALFYGVLYKKLQSDTLDCTPLSKECNQRVREFLQGTSVSENEKNAFLQAFLETVTSAVTKITLTEKTKGRGFGGLV